MQQIDPAVLLIDGIGDLDFLDAVATVGPPRLRGAIAAVLGHEDELIILIELELSGAIDLDCALAIDRIELKRDWNGLLSFETIQAPVRRPMICHRERARRDDDRVMHARERFDSVR